MKITCVDSRDGSQLPSYLQTLYLEPWQMRSAVIGDRVSLVNESRTVGRLRRAQMTATTAHSTRTQTLVCTCMASAMRRSQSVWWRVDCVTC